MCIKPKQHTKDLFERYLINRIGHTPQKFPSGAFMEYNVKLFYALWEEILPRLNLDCEQDKIFDSFVILACLSSDRYLRIRAMFL